MDLHPARPFDAQALPFPIMPTPLSSSVPAIARVAPDGDDGLYRHPGMTRLWVPLDGGANVGSGKCPRSYLRVPACGCFARRTDTNDGKNP